jgi:hypothetical protein
VRTIPLQICCSIFLVGVGTSFGQSGAIQPTSSPTPFAFHADLEGFTKEVKISADLTVVEACSGALLIHAFC